jgi:hypothetical protein
MVLHAAKDRREYKLFYTQIGNGKSTNGSACREGKERNKCFCMQGRLNNAVESEYRRNKWLLRKYLRKKRLFTYTNRWTLGQ